MLCTLHTVCVAMAAAQRAGGMVIVAQQKLSVSSDCDDGAKMTMHFVYLCRAIWCTFGASAQVCERARFSSSSV